MTFDELVVTMAAESRYTRREIRKLMRLLAFVIKESVKEGRDVHLYGVGTFVSKLDGVRYGRNSSTGEKLTIPPKRRLRFVPAVELKKAALKAPTFADDLAERFGLKKEKEDGKVRSGDRPQEGAERKTGRRRE